MLGKVWTVAVVAAVAGLLALPAPAAYAQGTTTPAVSKPAMKSMAMKPMAMKKASHKMDCSDYAWQSAAMNNCMAKKTSSDGMSKPMKKSSKKKKIA